MSKSVVDVILALLLTGSGLAKVGLVALFESIAHPTIDCDKQFAKECARRSWNETKKEIHNYFFKLGYGFKTIESYIQKVEEEIESI
jgi:hypothetical protein